LKELIVLVDEDEVPKEVLEAVKKQEQLHLNVIGGDLDDDE
jgi:hypothetical protein